METGLRYKIALSQIKGMNRLFAGNIVEQLGDAERFFTLKSSELAHNFGSEAPQFRNDVREEALKRADEEVTWLGKNARVTPVFCCDEGYPVNLNDCDDAPVMLYVAGNPDVLNSERTVGMVGTRNATLYGETFINGFVRDLSEIDSGILIVSGLAYGIDIMSHKAALENGLPTAAVVAHGLSTIYPATHRGYARTIIERGGAIVTEYIHSAPIHRVNFLARNRIVAGLSDCLIIVESDIKGGAMATATNANDYGRDVFAVPGRFNDRFSSGCNHLIQKNKACILTGASELALMMKWESRKAEGSQRTIEFSLPPDRQAVVDYLLAMEMKQEQFSFNRMAVDLGMTVPELNRLTAEMEFDGQIVRLAGNRIAIAMGS